ncbi:MAG TPA: response regulator transcription factor [Candidatus Obscuribacterales bacterium]
MAKVLLIEDDSELTSMIVSWLEGERHLVEVALDGIEGMDKIRFNQYDVIILDLSLPHRSGLDILKEFRQERGTTPIIILTGRQKVSDKEEGLDAGADDYLTKPFSMKELSARLRALLRRSRMSGVSVLQVGDLTLDPDNYLVKRASKEIHLLPRDFSLLEFFMRHPGKVFSTETLLARVWHSDSEASGEAVRTAIKRLRKKLDEGDDESDSIIENVPRVGYRLRDKARG